MLVTVRLFAMLREQAGWRERGLELPDGSSIEDAWAVLATQNPAIAASRQIVRFARNGEYADAGQALHDGDQLVLIPPVAGGAEADAGAEADGGAEADATGEADGHTAAEPFLRCQITDKPITDDLLAELRRTVPTSADGALVIFVGQTRETPGTPAPGEERQAARHAGEPVIELEYEAFEEMALAVLSGVGAEIEQRFGVRRLAIVHRTGRVAVTEPSVVIAAAATHRSAAFDACRYAIDELKARAPIWKAEHYADGSVWIGSPARTGPAQEEA